ncbi:hypothetical protein [Streptomyces sp. NPDC020983]|uniref:hypothetical protein n=1 Tax=Streptomyces sp. NPDC020983 TaxID=3365106 RepID=UPI0037A26F73
MPGLLPPRSDAAEDSAPEPADTDAAEGAAAPAAEDASVTAEAAAPEAEAAGKPAPAEAADDDADAEDEVDRGEPLFEVSDRRATILADKVGIIFRLDEEEADFTWDEIGAVEIDTPRFGKRFKVTVYTGPRRWFEAHVEARSRSLLKTWTAELDAVLDEHFEDPEAATDEPEEPGTAEPGTEESAQETAEAPATADGTEAADAEAKAEAVDAEAETEAEEKAEEAPAPAPASGSSALKPDKPLKPNKPAGRTAGKAAGKPAGKPASKPASKPGGKA